MNSLQAFEHIQDPDVRHAGRRPLADGPVAQLKAVAGDHPRGDGADVHVPVMAEQPLRSDAVLFAVDPVAPSVAGDVAEEVAAAVAVEEEHPHLGFRARPALEDGDVELGVRKGAVHVCGKSGDWMLEASATGLAAVGS